MEFRILGPLEVVDGDAPIRLGGEKQRALLARLLLERGRSVPAGALVEDLWGEEAPETASKMVQIYVSQLRKVLPADTLRTAAPGYAVHAGAAELDLDRFERLRDEGRAALAAGDAEQAAGRLRDALGLWRGAPLAGLDGAPFAPREAARLEELRVSCIEDRVDADLASGRTSGLAPELERLIERHPLRERLREQLMLALHRDGRTAEALAAYRAFARTLDEELGLVPSQRLTDLESRILRGVEDDPLPARPARSEPPRQDIRFCTSRDGTRLAYAQHGEGPPLVRASTWLTHLEYDWASEVWRHWVTELGRHHRCLRYDERGCGLSDRDVGDLSLDRWVEDLEAVVDAAGLERFPILGVSQGAAIAIAYAARHPERVSALLLYGGYARGRNQRDEEQRRVALAMQGIIAAGWTAPNPAFRRLFSMLFLPDGTEEQLAWYDELQRRTATPEAAAELYRARGDLNIVELAPLVRCPTLVLHGREDAVVPFEEGRLLASAIPGARLVPLESRNHVLLEHEPAWGAFVSELRAFLG